MSDFENILNEITENDRKTIVDRVKSIKLRKDKKKK